MRRHRIIEALCQEHADQARTVWPIAGDIKALAAACAGCSFNLDRLRADSSINLRALPTLTADGYIRAAAIHEAAHAIVGVVAGLPLKSVRLNIFGDEHHSTPGAEVNWGPYSVPVDGYLAMCWAGQQAVGRWLAGQWHDVTAADLVDVSFLGWDDTRQALNAIETHQLAARSGWTLGEQMVDERWEQIEALAALLVQQRCLLGDEVISIVGEVPSRG